MDIHSYHCPSYLNKTFTAENALLQQVRSSLIDHSFNSLLFNEELSFRYDPKISRVSLLLFQRGNAPIRYGSKRKTLVASLTQIIKKLKAHSRFSSFQINNASICRILFEVVIEETPCEIKKVKHSANNKNCFDPGISGLKLSYPSKTAYFMPTDAVVKNRCSVRDVLLLLSRKTYIAEQTRKKSQRLSLMKSEPIDYFLIKTVAFITYKDQIMPLFRGYPYPLKVFNQEYLFHSTIDSIKWLLNNQHENGQFIYFYDGITDKKADIDHPKNPDYYNMLRHSGAIIALLLAYELSDQDVFLKAASKAINYLLLTFKNDTVRLDLSDQQKSKNQYTCFPMCNGKAKLGGAGISLVALMKYYQFVPEYQLKIKIDGLVRHILSRIEVSGELLPFYIHPKYNGGKSLDKMDDATKKELFSFYYPGEAMLGLALYYRHMPDIDADFKQLIQVKSKLAMDFLVEQRPIKYPELFNRVPDDAWLMQAIEEWLKVEAFQKASYYDFLYQDATAIIEYMRSREDSPLINIGARSEGVIAAYYAAKRKGDNDKADYFIKHIILSVKGLRKTQHTAESTYAHLYPEKTINTFSFRMTNQWIRIDTIQHTACLLARLYQSNKVQ